MNEWMHESEIRDLRANYWLSAYACVLVGEDHCAGAGTHTFITCLLEFI